MKHSLTLRKKTIVTFLSLPACLAPDTLGKLAGRQTFQIDNTPVYSAMPGRSVNLFLCCSLLVFFSLLNGSLISQNDDWLQDPAINYLIEVEAEVKLEEVIRLDRNRGASKWERLKLTTDCPFKGELTDWFSSILLYQIEMGELSAQSTTLGEKLTFAEVSDLYVSLDTVITFHPATYEEMVQVVRYQHRLSSLRLKIQLAWNDALYKLQAQVVGLYATGHKGEDEGILFYLPLAPKAGSVFNINDEDWGWVGKSELVLDWKTASVIKGASIAAFIEEVFLEEVFEYYTLLVYADHCNTDPLTDSELDILSTNTDTLTIYDPDTYEASTRVTYRAIEAEDLSMARLGLNCYFSADLTSFHFVPQWLSPLEAKRDDDGSIRSRKPLYYLGLE
jgi:hypothetical protein